MVENFPALAVTFGTLVVALAVLIYCADRLVAGSEALGLSLGVPPFLLGITILAVGTSLPELVTGLFAVYEGTGELVVGTVLGSNIANILFILGCSAFFAREIEINWDLLHGDLPVLFGSVLLMVFAIYPISYADQALFLKVSDAMVAQPGLGSTRSVLTPLEGLVLLGGYGLYLYYYSIKNPNTVAPGDPAYSERVPVRLKDVLWIVVGLIGVPIGAAYTVDAAVDIAGLMLVDKSVVAASMIAVGTSLPELIVSLSAVRRGNFEMALGNVTGSNIFNTFVVLGLPALLAPWMGNKGYMGVGENSILFLQTPYYIGTVILFLVIVLDKRLTRTEGLVILIAYGLFLAKLFSLV